MVTFVFADRNGTYTIVCKSEEWRRVYSVLNACPWKHTIGIYRNGFTINPLTGVEIAWEEFVKKGDADVTDH